MPAGVALSEYLEPERVLFLEGEDSHDVLAELVAAATPDRTKRRGEILAKLEEREALGSTGIGGGVAIPHVRLEEWDEVRLVVGIHAQGIDFAALDGQPVRLFFLVLAPDVGPGLHLKLLARIARLVRSASLREALMNAHDPVEVIERIRQAEAALVSAAGGR